MLVLKLTLGLGTLILQAIQRMNGLISNEEMGKFREEPEEGNKKGLFNGPRRTLGDLAEM